MNSVEKNDFANKASEAIDHLFVQEVMEEYAGNMGFKMEGLPRYGLRKVARYAAIVARAQALGIDLGELRMTDEEYGAHAQRLMQAAVAAGKPVFVVINGDESKP